MLAGDCLRHRRQRAVPVAVPLEPVRRDLDPNLLAVPFTLQRRAGSQLAVRLPGLGDLLGVVVPHVPVCGRVEQFELRREAFEFVPCKAGQAAVRVLLKPVGDPFRIQTGDR